MNALHSLHSFSFFQTARITDLESSALKAEMRGHDNRIECAVFVPLVSIPSVQELMAVVHPFLSPSIPFGIAESSINLSSLPRPVCENGLPGNLIRHNGSRDDVIRR